MIKEGFFSILKWFASWRATPYLVLLLLIFLLVLFKWDAIHDELRRNLITELLGALILLIAFDALQSWRIQRSQEHEATYRLYVVHQIISPHVHNYLNYLRAISTSLSDRRVIDIREIKFTDMQYLYNPSIFVDAAFSTPVYHLYFNTLFRLENEINRSLSTLSPAHHFHVIELFREFISNCESTGRLFDALKERDRTNNKQSDIDFLKNIESGEIDQSVDFISTNSHVLTAYAKMYKMSMKNVQIIYDYEAIALKKFSAFKTLDGKSVQFEL